MSTHYNEDEVRTFRAPKTTEISKDICPGCMRPRHGVYFASHVKTPFCDRFCEELWRRHQQRRLNDKLPWEERRGSFFGPSVTGIKGGIRGWLTYESRLKITAQYEPESFRQ